MTMQEMNIREHMDVLGADGEHVGTVDHVDGNRIKLTRKDSPDGQHHHFIPLDWISRVDEHVHLTKSRDEAMQQWMHDDSIGA